MVSRSQRWFPGRVSIEVDARLSYDTTATIAKARRIVALFDAVGVDKSRLLIKIAATWEGIRAAEVLEKDGINCNLTLIFGFAQARACAEARCFPDLAFRGPHSGLVQESQTRVRNTPQKPIPGVVSVTGIYNWFKTHGYPTVVMGASFRNTGEIKALAGLRSSDHQPGTVG